MNELIHYMSVCDNDGKSRKIYSIFIETNITNNTKPIIRM
jgi:hypothetical protein